jgi:fermentation-respiration switch protein FrsA (DUF1100 family)
MSWLTKAIPFGKKGVNAKKLTHTQIAARILAALLILLAVVVAALFIFKDRLLYYPAKGLELSIKDTGWPFEDVWLEGSHGERVNAWYLPSGPKAVLILHGNSDNLEMMVGRIIMYHKLGYSVLAVDYEGFGLSGGSPDEAALYHDAKAARAFLADRGYAPEDITIYGFSLGGAVAARLASETGHTGPLILDSTFTSIEDVGLHLYPAIAPISGPLLGGQYDTLGLVGSLKPSRLIVFHSFRDEIVPYAQGQNLFETYQGGPKTFVQLVGRHMDYLPNQYTYYRVIRDNLGLVGGEAAAARPEDQAGAEPAADLPEGEAGAEPAADLPEGEAGAEPAAASPDGEAQASEAAEGD